MTEKSSIYDSIAHSLGRAGVLQSPNYSAWVMVKGPRTANRHVMPFVN
jgi:hypothetical protein